jgi:hypothetical protein
MTPPTRRPRPATSQQARGVRTAPRTRTENVPTSPWSAPAPDAVSPVAGPLPRRRLPTAPTSPVGGQVSRPLAIRGLPVRLDRGRAKARPNLKLTKRRRPRDDPSATGRARSTAYGSRSCSFRQERRPFRLLGNAAGSRWRRDNELPVDDLRANRRSSPSAVCPRAFCVGGLRGAQRQYGEKRERRHALMPSRWPLNRTEKGWQEITRTA